MPDDATVIDIDGALKRALGDAAFLQMMFDEFREMIPEFVADIRQAIENSDMDRLGKQAHQLKGSAANLGAIEIADAAFQLEKAGKDGDPAAATTGLDRLENAVERFEHRLAQIDWVPLNSG